MSTKTGRTSLADWIASVRQELTDAQTRYEALPKTTSIVGLDLQEVTLEAQVVAESSEEGGVKVELFVLTIEGAESQKGSSTQTVTLKFKPRGRHITMGDSHERSAFDDQ